MTNTNVQDLSLAKRGDVEAFNRLYAVHQENLKSYLYRMTANRSDAEDFAHDTFIRAFKRIGSFAETASFKTWLFAIATNLALDALRRRKRWTVDVSAQAKELVLNNRALAESLETTARTSPYGRYEIREHIDTCFTCISKTLPLRQQVAVLLKDVYGFSVSEMMQVLELSEGAVKYALQTARKTLTEVFAKRCALVNKNGACHQCTELNGWFNPAQRQAEAVAKVTLVEESKSVSHRDLLNLRTALVRGTDPLNHPGHHLQEELLRCNSLAMGEGGANGKGME